MTVPEDRFPLDYRARPVRALPEWLSRDKLAELFIGLGWTACGTAALLTVVTWVFLGMEPRQPISGPWWAFIAFCLAFNTIGLLLALAAAPLRFWSDSILMTLWTMTLLLALCGYAAHAYLIASSPSPPKPIQPLQFQAPGDGIE